MRSSTIAAAVMAFASSVSAQEPGFAVFSTPKAQELVPAGKPYTLKWTAGTAHTGPAVLSLIGGETQPTQQFIANLTTTEVGANSFNWNVDCSLGKAKVYGLTITMIASPAIFQWSQPFRIDNSGCAGQSSSAASSAAPVSSSATASYPVASSAASSTAVYPTAPVSSTKVSTATSSAASASVTVSTKTNTESHAAQTSSVVTKSSTASAPTTTGSSIPVAAAPKVAAGSFALAGAAVAAILAL